MKRPIRELILSPEGLLLIVGPSRYDTLDEYKAQMGEPVSPTSTFVQFRDPIGPCLILVELADDNEGDDDA